MEKQEVVAAFKLLAVIAEAIRDSGPKGIPSGHLYAALMSKVTLETYQKSLEILKHGNLIEEKNFVLYWKG